MRAGKISETNAVDGAGLLGETNRDEDEDQPRQIRKVSGEMLRRRVAGPMPSPRMGGRTGVEVTPVSCGRCPTWRRASFDTRYGPNPAPMRATAPVMTFRVMESAG